jgi:hypothetical protein
MFAETTATPLRARTSRSKSPTRFGTPHAHQAARPLTPSRVFLSSASLAKCS